MPGQLKRGQGAIPVGLTDKSGSFEFYPIPNSRPEINKNQRKFSSFYLTETGLTAAGSRSWSIIPSRKLTSPVIIHSMDIQVTHLSSTVTYAVANKLVVDFNFTGGNNSGFSTFPISGAAIPSQVYNRINFQGPPDNTQIHFDGPLRIDADITISQTAILYATINAGDGLIWTAYIQWEFVGN